MAGRNKDDVEETIAMVEALAMRNELLIVLKLKMLEQQLSEWKRPFYRKKKSRALGRQDLEELMKEVQEARRIKMLHQPSKVLDMEHELRT
ncbi:hypothetical protein GOBAR_AA22757 [Gossypium barbadense]|uniref:Stomatal closure-related actin-binding protein coiled-coil domain-containing protein n=1 Tax=Gossypium barbadense TaxID=3634 RepID=A0A2P5X3J1_GOSBA|nr:hypothetical protein GOBAR_AA22757 [Gossypium barbadense]